MENALFSNCLRNLFDTVPFPIFIVDGELRIYFMNAAGSRMAGGTKEKRWGKALNCVYGHQVSHCGQPEYCKDCTVLHSVQGAIQGARVLRLRTRINLLNNGDVREKQLLVTAVPFEYENQTLAMLIPEDTDEIVTTRNISAICAQCKRVRTESNLWDGIEVFLKRRFNLDFSHSICPECAELLYPDFVNK